MKKVLLTLIASSFLLMGMAQSNKRALKHSDYDGWKDVQNHKISNDGEWISYEINPQKGDGYLYLYQQSKAKLDSFPRGYAAQFSANSKSLIFKIKAQFDTIRQAKLKKVKAKDLPKDSLAILNLSSNNIEKFANLKSYKTAAENGEWMAYFVETKKVAKDTTNKTDKPKKKKKKGQDKAKVGDLNLRNLLTNEVLEFSDVSDYSISRNGKAVTFITQSQDSISEAKVSLLNFQDKKQNIIFNEKGLAEKSSISSNGDKLAFIFSADTTKQKVYNLQYFDTKLDYAKLILDSTNTSTTKDWTVNENSKLDFSRDGQQLFFGIAPIAEKEKKDTLLDTEKYKVDVWSWKDPLLQSEQKVNLKKEQKRTYLAVYNTKKKTINQLANNDLPRIKLYDHGNANLALGSSVLPYQMEQSWNDWFSDYYLVNVETGQSDLVMTKKNSRVEISPSQKYLYWYETADSTWNTYTIANKKSHKLTLNIPFNFYSETHDTPSNPRPYGIMGWTEDDKYILIQDRYDIWKIDPKGKEKASNLTQGNGRDNKIRFNYIKLDKEEQTIDLSQTVLLKAFGEFNKKAGFYTLTNGESPKKICFEDVSYSTPIKAKDTNQLVWKRSTFIDYPNLWVSDFNFKNEKQISDANPQQKDILWGNVELVDWVSGDGDKLQGMLYKPENFDPNKKYPMLVYFYERSSDRLHKHYIPQPNWSIINPTYCVSNDYLVFMPDIVYPKVGYPGESAYSSVVTGTLAMMDRFDYIDKENVALQGQSWGGYQIGYLVTKTNLYKCAMAGAPVSNMTSAYGGIRWASGHSRMSQYEHTQSRIGGTLWEKPFQYIENSPIFSIPKIETPLLIMHNDHDGAVPWYQGIEFFVAMRRLQKPCWMLSYNNEAHNLKGRANRMDLSIRTMQFFDYYLKGEAAPAWMVDGIPAIKKGKYDGYELKK
ncbi:S9 family peptidase [Ancylomarina sp. 16SWW S1-10-2]|uniref:alpha/beta hydrolase family protein n=1 Tax=Ancylomarina sp. 16SWW S1-10-2 TaxID=2499681 RepID=UPI0012AE79F1|nr:prolyl oligopeptidase family serine peptidase [Ancylomarina sp. 16SWW S1-10-2]MRT94721.1 S9 family peptidase [Ancylomarina sp. 16SWW S1-10-2]